MQLTAQIQTLSVCYGTGKLKLECGNNMGMKGKAKRWKDEANWTVKCNTQCPCQGNTKLDLYQLEMHNTVYVLQKKSV